MLPEGEFQVIKGVHRCGRRGYVDFVVTSLPEAQDMQTDSAPLLGLEAEQLEQMVRQAGATRVGCFGGYAGGPYDREQSPDLILVAEK